MKELSEKEKEELSNLKIVQYAFADAHYKLSNRLQYLPEEFEQAMRTIGVLASFHKDITKKIEEIEPPAPKEEPKAQKPYTIDAKLKVVDGEEK